MTVTNKERVVPPKSRTPIRIPLAEFDLNTNDRRVFEALWDLGTATRNDLVQWCGLPRTTIYDAIVRLERKGLVIQELEPRTVIGRPKTFYLLRSSPTRYT